MLIAHKGPDGDAIGSLLALMHFLIRKGHHVDAVTPNEAPDFLKWMPGFSSITTFMRHELYVKACLEKAEVIVHMDYNEISRTGGMADLLVSHPAQQVLIDHHMDPSIRSEISFSDPSRCATADLVFDILHLWDASAVDQTIATCLYCGLMTDTGCFSYNANDPAVFEHVAALMRCGIHRDAIAAAVYDNYAENRMRLLGYCLSRKMEVFSEQHAALIVLSLEEQEQYHYQTGDSEGFVNYPFSIQGIVFSVFIREEADRVKISLRSRGDLDVRLIAQRYFNGGGHKNAAGGDLNVPLQTAVGRFYQVLAEMEKQTGTINP